MKYDWKFEVFPSGRPWTQDICWACWWSDDYMCWPHTLAWIWREEDRERRLGLCNLNEISLTS